MFNEFGKLEDGQIIHISDYKRGQKAYCEHCNKELIAKKGRVKIHHFAHKKGESCRVYFEGMNSVDFQLYKTLSTTQATILKRLVESRSNRFYLRFSYESYYGYMYDITTDDKTQTKYLGECKRKTIESLQRKGFVTGLKHNNRTFKITDLSKLYMLDLSFKESIKFFEQQSSNIENEQLIYTYKRLKSLVLYFIDIDTNNDNNFQKIGITSDFKRRKKEIERFLKKHYKDVKIKELKLCKLATLEHYFKKKYSEFQFKIGSATEYFKFNKQQIDTIKKELFKAQLSTKSHTKKIKEGLKNRSKKGRGKISKEDFLKKDLSKQIVSLLIEKWSIRKISEKLQCSTGTVQKVKRLHKEVSV